MITEGGKAKYSLRVLIEIDVLPNGETRWQLSERDKMKGARTDKYRSVTHGYCEKVEREWRNLDNLLYAEGVPAVIRALASALRYHARVAQLAEHRSRKTEDDGSIPSVGLS